jgi:hypothetical protein
MPLYVCNVLLAQNPAQNPAKTPAKMLMLGLSLKHHLVARLALPATSYSIMWRQQPASAFTSS